MLTKDGLSGSGSATQVAISLGIVVVLYTAVGVIAAILLVRHARRGLPDEPLVDSSPASPRTDAATPALTY